MAPEVVRWHRRWLRDSRHDVGTPVLTRLQSVHPVRARRDVVEDRREHLPARVGRHRLPGAVARFAAFLRRRDVGALDWLRESANTDADLWTYSFADGGVGVFRWRLRASDGVRGAIRGTAGPTPIASGWQRVGFVLGSAAPLPSISDIAENADMWKPSVYTAREVVASIERAVEEQEREIARLRSGTDARCGMTTTRRPSALERMRSESVKSGMGGRVQEEWHANRALVRQIADAMDDPNTKLRLGTTMRDLDELERQRREDREGGTR